MSGDLPADLVIVPPAADEPMRLGDDTTNGPGFADLVLFASGAVVAVCGTWMSNTGLVVVGAIVGLLGVVLPLRSLGRRMHARSAVAVELAEIDCAHSQHSQG